MNAFELEEVQKERFCTPHLDSMIQMDAITKQAQDG